MTLVDMILVVDNPLKENVVKCFLFYFSKFLKTVKLIDDSKFSEFEISDT